MELERAERGVGQPQNPSNPSPKPLKSSVADIFLSLANSAAWISNDGKQDLYECFGI